MEAAAASSSSSSKRPELQNLGYGSTVDTDADAAAAAVAPVAALSLSASASFSESASPSSSTLWRRLRSACSFLTPSPSPSPPPPPSPSSPAAAAAASPSSPSSPPPSPPPWSGSIPHSAAAAVAIGVACGVSAYLYATLLNWLLDAVWKRLPALLFAASSAAPPATSDAFLATAPPLDHWLLLPWLVPVIVGFVFATALGGAVVVLGDPGDLAYTIHKVHSREAALGMDHVLPMVVTSLCSIVAGASLGPEAPLVAICASVAGFLSRTVFRTVQPNVIRKHTLMGVRFVVVVAFFYLFLWSVFFAVCCCRRRCCGACFVLYPLCIHIHICVRADESRSIFWFCFAHPRCCDLVWPTCRARYPRRSPPSLRLRKNRKIQTNNKSLLPLF